jgi:hypothetical protein
MRTVMYEIRKQPKMKVSLSRKIHIMAFPQETFLNARWSEDQSATKRRASRSASVAPGHACAHCMARAAQDQHAGIGPQQPGTGSDRQSLPCACAWSRRWRTARRASRRQPETCRGPPSPPACFWRTLPGRNRRALSPAMASRQPLLRQPPAAIGASPAMKQEDDRHGSRSGGSASGGWFCGRKSCAAPGTL